MRVESREWRVEIMVRVLPIALCPLRGVRRRGPQKIIAASWAASAERPGCTTPAYRGL